MHDQDGGVCHGAVSISAALALPAAAAHSRCGRISERFPLRRVCGRPDFGSHESEKRGGRAVLQVPTRKRRCRAAPRRGRQRPRTQTRGADLTGVSSGDRSFF